MRTSFPSWPSTSSSLETHENNDNEVTEHMRLGFRMYIVDWKRREHARGRSAAVPRVLPAVVKRGVLRHVSRKGKSVNVATQIAGARGEP